LTAEEVGTGRRNADYMLNDWIFELKDLQGDETRSHPKAPGATGGRRFWSLLSRPSDSLRSSRIAFLRCGHRISLS
jgi:hypothetical protein